VGSIAELISIIGQKAKSASNTLRTANTDTKNAALLNIALEIQENKQAILDANSLDIKAAKKK
jgi:glutamate-5-semialdehyde dehydrogenase